MSEYTDQTEFKIHQPKMNLVRTYLRHLPTLQESQAAIFLTGWPNQTQENLTERKPKLESRSVTTDLRI